MLLQPPTTRSLLNRVTRKSTMQSHFEDAVTRPLDANALIALIPALSDPRQAGHQANQGWVCTFGDDDDDNDSGDNGDDRKAALFDERARQEFAAGRYKEARALTGRAMTIRREHYGEAAPQLPDSLCALGVLSLLLGRIDEATWHFEEAIELLDHRNHRSGLDVASLYNNLGASARRHGDLVRAQAHYESALSIKVDLLGWQHKKVALTLTNLGRLAEQLGDLESAAARFAQAQQIAESTEGANGPTLAASLMGIGRVLLRRDDDVGARFAFEQALQIREAIRCSPRQLASSRFLLAIACEQSAPVKATALVVLAIQEYRAADTMHPENLEAMCSWLTHHNARTADIPRSRGVSK